MNILVINGSPKRRSNTMRLTEAFIAGLTGAGENSVETVDIINKNIKPCRGCFACWDNPTGKCIQSDDQNEVLDKFVAADTVIFSFPLYCYGMPSHLKAFVDRLIPLMKKSMRIENGVVMHDSLVDLSAKHFVVISGCGFPNWDGNFDALRIQCKTLFGNGITMACVPETPLMYVPGVENLIAPLLDKFRKAGAKYAEDLRLPQEIIDELETPVMPADVYVKLANSRG